MPKFVIERNMPGIGKLTPVEMQEAAAKANLLIRELGSEITWQQSYVTGDKLYCVYIAPGEDIILEHARCAGIPADKISQVLSVIDPSTGEETPVRTTAAARSAYATGQARATPRR